MALRLKLAPDRPGIRQLSEISAVVFGVLSITVAGALIWTSSQLHEAISTVNRDARSSMIADDLQLSLLTYQRISNLLAFTGEESLAAVRMDIALEMNRLLEEAAVYVGGIEERQLLQTISARLDAYFRERERREALEARMEEMIRATQPALNEAVAALESLRDINELQVQNANARALRVNRLSYATGGSAAILLLSGLATMILGVRRYILSPILDLHDTVDRFRHGDAGARAVERGSRESAELARAFNEMADALARQREDQLAFLAGVAHDLRNPLAGLRLGIYTLDREQTETGRAHTVMMLNRQVDRLSRMVDDLMDATRIEAGRLELRTEDLDLREIAEQVVQFYAPTSPQHQIVLRAPGDPVIVRADPLRIEQVISNLLSNAVKFSPGGGQVHVGIDIETHDAKLSVTDRGIGIHPEDIPGLFLPFRRRRPEVAAGAGLGLSVVRRIVEAHGGQIEVTSTLGEGSTFQSGCREVPAADRLLRTGTAGRPRSPAAPTRWWTGRNCAKSARRSACQGWSC